MNTNATPTLTVTDREEVLRWAARLTVRRADPAAVLANAEPLLTWLTQATTEEDQNARIAALRHQHANAISAPDYEPDDDPGRLLDEAQSLYRFLAPVADHS
jgi:hypothetical protein